MRLVGSEVGAYKADGRSVEEETDGHRSLVANTVAKTSLHRGHCYIPEWGGGEGGWGGGGKGSRLEEGRRWGGGGKGGRVEEGRVVGWRREGGWGGGGKGGRVEEGREDGKGRWGGWEGRWGGEEKEMNWRG